MKLFMVLLGCKPSGRHTEQHDVFFGIGETIKDLIPQMISFWPEAEGKLHIDGYREVTLVNGYQVQVEDAMTAQLTTEGPRLFFLNLGGYKENEFEEYHYKMLVAAADKGIAVQQAKQTAFYKHTGFKGATSHIDDKYGVDVDDIYAIEDILPTDLKQQYQISLKQAATTATADIVYLGYYKFNSL